MPSPVQSNPQQSAPLLTTSNPSRNMSTSMTNATADKVTEILDRIEERKRIRTLRMQRHLIVAAVAFVTMALMATSVDTWFEILLGLFLLGLATRSVERGLDLIFGDVRDATYSEPDSMRWADRLTERLVDACRPIDPPAQAEIKVRPLDPTG